MNKDISELIKLMEQSLAMAVALTESKSAQLVDWSCPLLKGCNTNYGEIFDVRELFCYGKVVCGQGTPSTNLLRLAHTGNWQAYNGENLNRLHEAGFVVDLRKGITNSVNVAYKTVRHNPRVLCDASIAAYRVIGIRDGFTDNPEEVV